MKPSSPRPAAFAVHQSRTNPTLYLCTPEPNRFDKVPPQVLRDLGDVRFLRPSRPAAEETPLIQPSYKAIVKGIRSQGYHILRWRTASEGG